MNFAALFRAVDTLVAVRDVARRFRRPDGAPPEPVPPAPTAVQGLAGQIETRLTNVVVAALKEAFDRDHARLELERSQIEEERRRAEAALRLELRRQAADRELARLRLVAGAAMVGWVASVAMLGIAGAAIAARVVVVVGWLLLLGALGMAFTAQRQIGAAMPDDARSANAAGLTATASLWLLVAGLAATAASLLF